ncbi:hypothetical protein FRC09_004850 [Ceratobasidium sp. 395]|nr:hypothetical protein FRC09_004850 [Ceratobasidium sp. 395]
MPKATFKDVQRALLKQYGIAVHVSDDGTFDIKEKAGRGNGVPARKRPIKVHASSNPGGSVSRGKYNLQSMMHMSDADYKLVCSTAKEVIAQTRGIDKDLSHQKQDPNVIELCVDKLLEFHPELHAYDEHGRWAPRAFFQKLLRTSSGKANAIAKLERDLAKVEATVKQEQARNQPAGGEQAATRQDAAAPETDVQQQAATPAEMPAKKRGRPKKVKSEPESQPALDGAPAAAPPVHNGAPAAVAQPDPVVPAQPPPIVLAESSGPTSSAPTQSASPSQPAPQGTSTGPAQPEHAIPRGNLNKDEVIDMDIHEEVDLADITMNSTLQDLSRLSLRKSTGKEQAGEVIEIGDDDDDDEDDGGKFDMALTMDKPAVKSTTGPAAKPTTEPAAAATVEPTVEPTATATIEPIVESTTESTAEPTVKATAGSSAKPTSEPATTSHNAPPASSVSAPDSSPIIPDSSSPPSVASSSTLVSAPSSLPVLRISLRNRTTKNDPPAPPATLADPNTVTPKDDAASSMLLAGPKLTPTTPFMSTLVAMIDLDIMWHGILISPAEMKAIRLAAIQQAQGGKPMRMAPIFDGLIAKFVADPEYDPSSEPDAPFEPPAPPKGRRGRVAPTAAADPVTEQPKAQPKAQPKRKPKMKSAPEPEPEPEPAPEPEPGVASSEPTTNNAGPDASDADGMEVDAPVGGGPGGKKGKGRQQAAKGGAKAKSGAVATETKAPKAPKVPAAPLRTSSRTTRANAGAN